MKSLVKIPKQLGIMRPKVFYKLINIIEKSNQVKMKMKLKKLKKTMMMKTQISEIMKMKRNQKLNMKDNFNCNKKKPNKRNLKLEDKKIPMLKEWLLKLIITIS